MLVQTNTAWNCAMFGVTKSEDLVLSILGLHAHLIGTLRFENNTLFFVLSNYFCLVLTFFCIILQQICKELLDFSQNLSRPA